MSASEQQRGPGPDLTRDDVLLDGARVVVTGAAQGIGRGIAIGLAAAGADVALLDLDSARTDATRAAVEALGRTAVQVAADVSDRDAVGAAVDAAAERLGGLTGLVNCAAVICENGPAQEARGEDMDRLWAVNVKGSLFAAQAAYPHLKAAGGGAVVNLSSQAGLVALPHQVVYTATKGAIVAMTRSLAIDWAPDNVNVNAIAPTFVWTPMAAPMLEDPAVHDASVRRIPLGRIGQPRDMAGAAVFLVSPAARLVTGHTLPVDGGWTAGEPGLDL
jgi:NAD(P)-dependent dehydrogenase (short-subunit alcohol dehydrogenase family)